MHEELSPRACEIAEHAKQLLAAGGYNGFSYADISDRVKIQKASIHHHFPSKADLVYTVIARYREQAQEGMAAMEQQIPDPLIRLQAYTRYWSECIRDGSSPMCICAMLAAELPMIPDEVAREVRGHFEDLAAWLATILQDGSTKGQFHLTDDATVEARTLMATMHGAMLAARAFQQPDVFESIARATVKQLTNVT